MFYFSLLLFRFDLPTLILSYIPTILILLLLAVVASGYRSVYSKFKLQVDQTAEDIENLGAYSADNVDKLRNCLSQFRSPEVITQLDKALQQAKIKYNDRWIPDLSRYLAPEYMSPNNMRKQKLYDSLPFYALAIGLLGSFTLWLLPFVNSNVEPKPAVLIILPLAVALIGLMVVATVIFSSKQKLSHEYQRLCEVFSRYLPIYTDHSGAALLVDSVLEHDYAMQASLSNFDATTRELVEGKFVDSITGAVRDVMENQVVPPIQDASATLPQLARDLAEKQDRDMMRLAEQFSEQVVESLGKHLNPLVTELHDFSELIADTRHFIHDSVAVLENSRQQNMILNRTIAESLHAMDETKTIVSQDMSDIRDHLGVLADVIEKISAIYLGEERGLRSEIANLDQSLNNSCKLINDGINAAGRTIEHAMQIRDEQQDQLRDLMRELKDVNSTLQKTEQDLRETQLTFTEQSDNYVKDKLGDFEQSLAEVVERLIYTASAIRDAVDTLPIALRADIERHL